MSVAEDGPDRRRAIDPRASFVIEAPAGSGKTELLTQRFLQLLGLVEQPEQVLAITFTRKAAAEMRQRVVATLQAAAGSKPVAPHRQASLQLAQRVLDRSRSRDWSLLDLSQRLQIQTIDALGAELGRHLPLLAGGVAGVDVTDRADELYRLAARRTLDSLGEHNRLGTALRSLLAATDNSLSLLEDWLSGLMPRRDQWLRLVDTFDQGALADIVEDQLARLCTASTAVLAQRIGAGLQRRLFGLIGQLNPDPDAGPDERHPAIWTRAARLLLTADGQWRSRFTVREGVPAGARELRDELAGLSAQLRSIPGLRQELTALQCLPDPGLSGKARASLEALAPILNRILAELNVVFAERRTVDHTELALRALQALGAVDAPSDLLLALDRRIEHILVDEFQDTSHLQWELLERLTAGWEAGDGRTLFLVGDPMQSIYRFRDADLSLFGRAIRQGIGEVRFEHLRLQMNYRSAPEIVDWINTAFGPLFPARESASSTNPAFGSAVAGRDSAPAAGVHIHAIANGGRIEENRRVVEIAGQETALDPGASIGILVRSRSHLIGLRAALAHAGMPAHAVEIDSLRDTPLGQDLIAFTSALLHAGDRLSWLGLLRGPCGGICWHDLLTLCGDAPDRSIPDLMADSARIARLSDEAARRLSWLHERLQYGQSLRATRRLGFWLRDCWQLIDGPASLTSNDELLRAEEFFRRIDALAGYADLSDPSELQHWFARPDGTETPAESGIEIMTIHRAKGLEFDTVILPGLSRMPRVNTSKLLLIQDIEADSGERFSLLATPEQGARTLYSYLRQLDREHAAAEAARLLYVATTRARERLHLIASVDSDKPKPRGGSLLAALWPAIDQQVSRSLRVDANAADDGGERAGGGGDSEFMEMPLRRLRIDTEAPLPVPYVDTANGVRATRPEFEWVNPASVQVGTIIHRELCSLSDSAAATGHPMPPAIEPARYRRELALLGVEDQDLTEAAQRVSEAIERVWNDSVGRWILEPRAEAWSELRLTLRSGDCLEHVRLDRSFIDDEGQRWIIDYKTGRHLGSDIDAFLDAEVERYRGQLEHYAQVVAGFDSRPIRVGLYFPLMGCLRDWIPGDAVRNQSEPD